MPLSERLRNEVINSSCSGERGVKREVVRLVVEGGGVEAE